MGWPKQAKHDNTTKADTSQTGPVSHHRFSFLSPEGIKTVRIKLLFGVFDLVAKAVVLNMKQFNGAVLLVYILGSIIRLKFIPQSNIQFVHVMESNRLLSVTNRMVQSLKALKVPPL